MGNRVQLSVNAAKDISAAQMLCYFKNGGSSDPITTLARFCSSLYLTSGEQFSYGFVSIPIGGIKKDELANSVALRQLGPAGKIKTKIRTCLGYNESYATQFNSSQFVMLMNGTTTEFVHSIGEDSLIGTVLDDRWILSKFTCFGRLCYNPTLGPKGSNGQPTGVQYFDAASPLIFNQNGFPDCIDAYGPDGYIGPRFAPGFRWGWTNDFTGGNIIIDTTKTPMQGAAKTYARSWTVQDVALYLHDVFMQGLMSYSQVDYWGQQGGILPADYIVWDTTAMAVLGNARSVHHWDIQNWSLLAALQGLGRKAGAYDLYMQPCGSFKSKITYVSMNPTNFNCYLWLADGEVNGTQLANTMVIQSGYIKESATDHFNGVCIAGDAPAVERFVSMSATDNDAHGAAPIILALEPAWSNDDQTAFNNWIHNFSGGADSQQAFKSACDAYPHVYASYRIKIGADIWEGTKYAGNKNKAPTRLIPHLLTGDNVNISNPNNFNYRDFKLTIEYALSNTGTWLRATKVNDSQISPDGQIIYLESLRSEQRTWYSTNVNNLFDGTKIVSQNIRLCMTMEADWRLRGLAFTDPNAVAPRIMDDPLLNFTYLSIAQPMDYVDYVRRKSAPIGWAQQETTKRGGFQDACALGSELFTDADRITSHAEARLKDVKRIAYTGQLNLARLNPGLYPGLGVTIASNKGGIIQVSSVLKSVYFDGSKQFMSLELAAADRNKIYDIPHSAPMNNTWAGNPQYPSSNYDSKGQSPASKPKAEQTHSEKYDSYSTAKAADTPAGDNKTTPSGNNASVQLPGMTPSRERPQGGAGHGMVLKSGIIGQGGTDIRPMMENMLSPLPTSGRVIKSGIVGQGGVTGIDISGLINQGGGGGTAGTITSGIGGKISGPIAAPDWSNPHLISDMPMGVMDAVARALGRANTVSASGGAPRGGGGGGGGGGGAGGGAPSPEIYLPGINAPEVTPKAKAPNVDDE